MEAILNQIMQNANELFSKGSREYEAINKCVIALKEAEDPVDEKEWIEVKLAHSGLTHAFLYNMKINSAQSDVAVQLEQVINDFDKAYEKQQRKKK